MRRGESGGLWATYLPWADCWLCYAWSSVDGGWWFLADSDPRPTAEPPAEPAT